MANSPSHRFGQIIGNLLEEIIYPFLQEYASTNGFYVDRSGIRGNARSGKKVTWEDKYGNNHDLDFVIEEGGTADQRGRPLAFIEAAWRRYTKHSRNKAQEIQGAILPIAEHHAWDAPFLGAIIAGVFTEGSIRQMESVGFTVLYVPYDTILLSFQEIGIMVAFDESTPDDDFKQCVLQIEQLSEENHAIICRKLVALNQTKIDEFLERMAAALTRRIEKIFVIPLFGTTFEFTTIDDAKFFLSRDFALEAADGLQKIEVIVMFSNGDKIDGNFRTADKASEFMDYVRSS